jgi:outer membrane protein assembly factor BamA
VPVTQTSLAYDLLKRKNSYTLHSVRSISGYSWKESFRKSHELNILDLNFVHAVNITDQYRELAESDLTLRKAIEDQFTIGSGYKYVFSNTAITQKINTIYYSSAIDLSGNIIGLVTGANIREGNVKRIFGTPFSQYIKLDNDLRYYWKISERARLANRIFVGIGYPYGNSISLPFVKQYFIGGSSSVRAFRAREAGPGSYYAPDDPNAAAGFTADQSGDIKLELSTEYRRQLIGILHGALFVDAGNIWLVNEELDPEARKEGALFSSRFLKDLLVGAGAGLRIDLRFVLLRFDLAFPLRKPWLPDGERWVYDDLKFGDPSWRKENLVFHVAIGYPF